MVMLSDTDYFDFPRLDIYLQIFHNVQENEKVWDAFLKWSCLDASSAADCVAYGTYPIIKVKKKLFDPYDYGCFNPNRPDEIQIRRDSAQTYNKTSDGQKMFETEKYLEMLILHELVHWGRFWTWSSDKEVDGLDSGKRFAREAYANPAKPHLG